MVALKTGNFDQAEADFHRMAAIYHAVFGEKNKHTALGELRFGEFYAAQGKFDLAARFFRQSAQTYLQSLSADNVQTGTARVELGDALLHERKYKAAEAELLAGYRIVEPGRSPSLESTLEARRDLAALYTAVGNPAEAAKFRISH